MKRILLSIFAFVMSISLTFAQQAIFERHEIVSPKFNADGTVTFTLRAPEAKKVTILADFLTRPTEELQQKDGVWTYTSDVLAPELYSYRFYVDGAETLDPSNLNRSRDVRSFMSTFIISKEEGDCGYLYGNHNVAHGDVAQVWYDSPTLGMKRRMSIYTPAGYDKGKKYPVMYLLHGAGGDEEAWLTLGRTAQIMDNLIALGKAEPMIVVMPNGNASDDASPYATGLTQKDRPKASYQESFPDIMDYVSKHYKVKKGADNTALCGLSMGGFHTWSISNLNPGKFGYIGLYSAAVRMDRNSKKSVDVQLEENTEVSAQMKAVFDAKPHLYWIAIGKDDFLYDQNVGLRKYLDKMGYPYEYYESEGGHIWRNWRIYLTIFAQRLFK